MPSAVGNLGMKAYIVVMLVAGAVTQASPSLRDAREKMGTASLRAVDLEFEVASSAAGRQSASTGRLVFQRPGSIRLERQASASLTLVRVLHNGRFQIWTEREGKVQPLTTPPEALIKLQANFEREAAVLLSGFLLIEPSFAPYSEVGIRRILRTRAGDEVSLTFHQNYLSELRYSQGFPGSGSVSYGGGNQPFQARAGSQKVVASVRDFRRQGPNFFVPHLLSIKSEVSREDIRVVKYSFDPVLAGSTFQGPSNPKD